MQRNKATYKTAGRTPVKVVQELAGVLSSLRRLLLEYAPSWYASTIDARSRKALAEAEAFQSTANSFEHDLVRRDDKVTRVGEKRPKIFPEYPGPSQPFHPATKRGRP